MPDTTTPLFNVIAIPTANAGGAVRTIATNATKEDAEAIVAMAVARRGIETECYKTVPVRKQSDTTAPMRARIGSLSPDVARTALELLFVAGDISSDRMQETIGLARELSNLRCAAIVGDVKRG